MRAYGTIGVTGKTFLLFSLRAMMLSSKGAQRLLQKHSFPRLQRN
jgi:hypothetical protein